MFTILRVIRQKILRAISLPFILILWIYIQTLQFILGLELVADIHHQFFRLAHRLFIRFAKTITKIAPKWFVDSVAHTRDPKTFPGEDHQYVSAGPHDSRSPCPALNTLANHHFLHLWAIPISPHDGRNIHPHQFVDGLCAGFNLTRPLAWFLMYGTYLLMRQWGPISLQDLARHSCVEHNASLAHRDCREDSEYAPIDIATRIFRRLVLDSSDGLGLTADDIAKARVRRERESEQHCNVPLDAIHAEIARGEMALVLDIFGKVLKEDAGPEIEINLLQEWWIHERFPDGWAPQKKQGLLATIRTAGEIRADMRELEKKNKEEERKKVQKKKAQMWRRDTDDLKSTIKRALTDPDSLPTEGTK